MHTNRQIYPGRRAGATAFLIFCTASCSIMDGTPDIEVYPAEDYQIIPADRNPSVDFSYPVVRKDAEELFLVEYNDAAVPGRLAWNDNTLTFIPEEPLVPGKQYAFSFEGRCADTTGKEHRYYHYIPFFSGADEYARFYMEEASPPPGSLIRADEEIRLIFSKEIDPDTLEGSFRVSPLSEMEKTVSATAVTLTPEEPFPEASEVTIHFPRGRLHDRSGTPLDEDIDLVYLVKDNDFCPEVSSFTVRMNEPALDYPELPDTGYDALSGDEVFGVSFSAPMDHDSVESSISVYPGLAVNVCWIDAASALIIPESPLMPEEEYCLTIGTDATGTGGLRLAEPYTVLLASATPWIQLERIELVGDGTVLTEYDNPGPEVITLGPGLSDYTIGIELSLPAACREERQIVQEGVLFSCVFPPSGGSPVPVGYTWESDRRLMISYTGLVSSSPDEDRYYRLALAGGSGGISLRGGTTCLEEDIEVLLRCTE